MDWMQDPAWPRDEFGNPKRIWDMGPAELDVAAEIVRGLL